MIGAILGAFIGSFLNVVIYRLPRGMSLSDPPKSFCPTCKHSLGVADLVPLFSWLMSGGKCRHCTEKVSARYFFVELLTAGLWGGIWYVYFAAHWEPIRGVGFAIAAALLVAIIYIDWELYIIPDELNAVLMLVGVGLAAVDNSWKFMLIGALTGWGALWGITLLGRVMFGKDAMGHGDIKMMRGVGAVLGAALTLVSLMVAVVAGLVIGLVLMGVASRQAKKDEPATDAGEEAWEPESIASVFKHGIFYLLCGDIIGIVVPAIYKLIGEEAQPETLEDDSWEPSLTTIPFGPYLAIGTLICLLFFHPVSDYADRTWKQASGADTLPGKAPSVYRNQENFHLIDSNLLFADSFLCPKVGQHTGVGGTWSFVTSSHELETLELHPYVA